MGVGRGVKWEVMALVPVVRVVPREGEHPLIRGEWRLGRGIGVCLKGLCDSGAESSRVKSVVSGVGWSRGLRWCRCGARG